MSPSQPRLAWPDIAKGISILGVVLLHVTLTVPESSETRLAAFNVWLDPLRLPLFFLVSGYFSSKVFSFTFPQLFARRLWCFLVPYVVWMAVELQVKRVELHCFARCLTATRCSSTWWWATPWRGLSTR